MKGMFVVALLAVVFALACAEQCRVSSDCRQTLCAPGTDVHLGCSSGWCTCYKRNNHGYGCSTEANCQILKCDDHKAHCIDSYCHCGSLHHHSDDK